MPDLQTPIRKYVVDRSPSTLGNQASVSEATRLMHTKGCDSVLITSDDGCVQGIFTERDFLNRVIAEGRDPDETLLAEVMTPDPDVLGPAAPISYAINRMAIRRFRNVPIVDEAGHAIAVLGVRDVIQHLSDIVGELDRLPLEDSTTSSWIDIGGGD